MKKIVWLLCIRLLINFADSLFYMATIWHISEQPNSSSALGIVVALFTLPEVILFLLGPIIDRANPKKLLALSVGINVVILAIMVLFNIVQFSFWFLACILIAEIFSSATYTMEDVVLPKIVDKEQLIFANSVFALSYKVLDFIFNAFAGVLLLLFTIHQLYTINAFVFALVFIPLMKFKSPAMQQEQDKFNYMKELAEGLRYIGAGQFILALTLPLVLVNFTIAMTNVAYPYYVREFDNPELLLTLFSFAAGIGGMIGNSVLPKVSRHLGIGKLISLFLCLNSIFWAVAFVQPSPIIMLLLVAASYMCAGVYNPIYETLFQVMVPEQLLGRVNTLIDSLVSIAMPVGAVFGGFLLNYVPVVYVMLLYATLLLATAIFYYTQPKIRELAILETFHDN